MGKSFKDAIKDMDVLATNFYGQNLCKPLDDDSSVDIEVIGIETSETDTSN